MVNRNYQKEQEERERYAKEVLIPSLPEEIENWRIHRSFHGEYVGWFKLDEEGVIIPDHPYLLATPCFEGLSCIPLYYSGGEQSLRPYTVDGFDFHPAVYDCGSVESDIQFYVMKVREVLKHLNTNP